MLVLYRYRFIRSLILSSVFFNTLVTKYNWVTLNALGKYEEALSKLDESLALHPLNSAAHALRVDVLYNLSRYDKAWQAAHKAREAKIDIPKGSLERLAQALPEPIHNP